MTKALEINLAIAALGLLRSRHGSPGAVRKLLESFPRPESDADALEAFLAHAGVSPAEVNGSVSQARADIEKGVKLGIIPIMIGSPGYPRALRMIPDAPAIIYARGSLDALIKVPGIAIVGTRNASPHGLKIAERIAAHVSSQGWCVVSGLALGIDASAHEGALKGTAPTIAVLAHGLERASPRANEPLALRILDQGGLWISEHPFGTSARPEYFVQRNRIQVGLSAASVIVEGALKSGSMTQAEYCMRYRRELFAVVPESDSSVTTQSILPRMLVKERGANAIRTLHDYPRLLEVAGHRVEELRET